MNDFDYVTPALSKGGIGFRQAPKGSKIQFDP